MVLDNCCGSYAAVGANHIFVLCGQNTTHGAISNNQIAANNILLSIPIPGPFSTHYRAFLNKTAVIS
jgi:hypothetical protein